MEQHHLDKLSQLITEAILDAAKKSIPRGRRKQYTLGGTTNYRSCMKRSAKPELHRNKTLQMQTWRTPTKQEQSSPDISFTKPELRGMNELHPSVWKRTLQNSGDSPSCLTKRSGR